MRSAMPPWPGTRPLLSLMPSARFSADSARSPNGRRVGRSSPAPRTASRRCRGRTPARGRLPRQSPRLAPDGPLPGLAGADSGRKLVASQRPADEVSAGIGHPDREQGKNTHSRPSGTSRSRTKWPASQPNRSPGRTPHSQSSRSLAGRSANASIADRHHDRERQRPARTPRSPALRRRAGSAAIPPATRAKGWNRRCRASCTSSTATADAAATTPASTQPPARTAATTQRDADRRCEDPRGEITKADGAEASSAGFGSADSDIANASREVRQPEAGIPPLVVTLSKHLILSAPLTSS